MTTTAELLQPCLEAFTPTPVLDLAEYSNQYFKLSKESSAFPGNYDYRSVMYQKFILEKAGNRRTRSIVLNFAAQCGKTTLLNAILLSYIHKRPSPIIYVLPTEAMARAHSTEKIKPMLRDSGIDKLIPDAKGSTNTILQRTFSNGAILSLVGSNSPSNLAARSCRVAFLDETSRFDQTGAEGNVIDLVTARLRTFADSLLIMASTPTDAECDIWKRFNEPDRQQYHYHLRCRDCNELFKPTFDLVHWDKTELGEHLPRTAKLVCPHCGTLHDDGARTQAIRNGEWIQENDCEYPEHIGFTLNSISSPFIRLSDMVTDFLAAKGDSQRLKAFLNTWLAEVFKEEVKEVTTNLVDRVKPFDLYSIPTPVEVLTAAVDTQDSGFHITIIGHADRGHKYVIDHRVIVGSPGESGTWDSLKTHLTSTYRREDDTELNVHTVVIDSGGHFTQQVYDYCKDNHQRRWFAIKGTDGPKPLIAKLPSYSDKGKFWIVGSDTAKEMVYTSLMQEDERKENYWHFSDSLSADYFQELTAEERYLKKVKGRNVWAWRVKPSRRNEATDTAAYNLCAFASIGLTIPQIASKRRRRQERQEAAKNGTPDASPLEPDSSTIQVPEAAPVQTPAKARKIQIRRPARQSSWL